MDVSRPSALRTRRRANLVTVASVPSSHVYVRHLAPEHGGAVVRLPDPAPQEHGESAEQRWWPPAMLSPSWVDAHAFDVFHLHFGFDAWPPDELGAVLTAVRERGRPFVYTVHDLRNPHHATSELHDQQLDVLVPAADAVMTLTPGAAAEIRRRWGRDATVVPHPHVVPLDTMERLHRRPDVRRPERFRVGLHLKSLRESMAPARLLPTLERCVRALPGGVLQVNGHRDVLEPGGARYDAELAGHLHDAAARGTLELRVHDFLSDVQLWRYLASLDASVLPYRFGTHSGWLEACRDLGTTVIAPDCGYFAEQGPVVGYHHDEAGIDEDSLVRAVRTAWRRRRLGATTVSGRRRQRQSVAARHEELYRQLIG